MEPILVPDSYNILVNRWREKINSPLAPAKKIIHVAPNDKGWNADTLKQECLKNLEIIDRFSRQVLKKHTVVFAENKMQVYINFPDEPEQIRRNNAFWQTQPLAFFENNREGYVSVGITDPDAYTVHFATCLDLLSHEFGHSIPAYTCKYNFNFQPGSLDESFADIFAIMVRHFHHNTVSESPDADWCLMRGIRRNDTKIGGLRRLDLPGEACEGDRQPRHMLNLIPATASENAGGRHWNCSIPSHAFYRVATALGGPCYERPGNIWVNSVWNGKPDDNFQIFAQRTIQSSRDLHYSSHVLNVVNKAWFDVGVDLRMPITPEPSTTDLLNYLMAKRPPQ